MTEQEQRTQRDLGAIIESLKNGDDHRRDIIRRLDQQSDKADRQGEKLDQLSGDIRNIDQAVKAQSSTLNSILLQKHEERIAELERVCKNVPLIDGELAFWRRVIGGGLKGLSKIVAILVGTGAIGALVQRYWPWH